MAWMGKEACDYMRQLVRILERDKPGVQECRVNGPKWSKISRLADGNWEVAVGRSDNCPPVCVRIVSTHYDAEKAAKKYTGMT